jgi:hypothetical protein
MAVGCLITCTDKGLVIDRRPIWPWPHPLEYPKSLPNGLTKYFFPFNYTYFPIHSYVTKEQVMLRPIASNVTVGTKHIHTQTVDILLGLYPPYDSDSEPRPAILLMTAPDDPKNPPPAFFSEPFGKATVNVPNRLFPAHELVPYLIAGKNYSENEGLWDYLLALKDKDGEQLFYYTGIDKPYNLANVEFHYLGVTLRPVWDEMVREFKRISEVEARNG